MIELDYCTRDAAFRILDTYVYDYPCEQGSLFDIAAALLDLLHHSNRLTQQEVGIITEVGEFVCSTNAINNQWLYNFKYGLKELGYYG